MKPRFSNHRNHALTRIEVSVIVVAVSFLFCLGLTWLKQAKQKSRSICCNCNLKQIGLSVRIWEGDHGDKYPTQTSVTNGGAMELVAVGNVVAWFRVMSNELSTPIILVCPADTIQIAATNFTADLDGKISYFAGLDAVETDPQALLSGDDNFEIGGVPVKSGLLELFSNASVAWSAARHKFAGNIGLADGSVQSVNNFSFTNYFQQTGLATNRLAIP